MRFYGASNVGLVRSENQDRFGIYDILPGVTLCVICDGMGGSVGGSMAAELALEAFADMMREMIIPDSPDDAAEINDRTVRDAFRAAVYAANSRVYNKALDSNGRLQGMGTTLNAMLITEKGFAWSVNVGDSRLYRITGEGAEKLTRDHSYVQQLVDFGTLTPDEARHFGMKNVITRAVGTDVAVEADIISVDTLPCSGKKGVFMLCSDGLYNCVDDVGLVNIFLADGSPKSMAAKLISSARAAGGPDNITVIVAEPD